MSAVSLTKEQFSLQERARQFAVDIVAPRAKEIDESSEYPSDLAQKLAEANFMGMTVPEAYGGCGSSLVDALIVIEEVAKESGVVGRIIVDANTAVPEAIACYGTDEQKQYYLPLVVAGEKPAIAMTEPRIGSAASELETSAFLDGDTYVINGEKRWISGGGVSQFYLVLARFEERSGAGGIGGLLVESGDPGFSVTLIRKTMGGRGMPEADIVFDNCRVPRDRLLIGPGDGFKRLMSVYNCQRLGAAAVALGISQGAFNLAMNYAKTRQQFGRPIIEFQGLQWMIADMHVKLEAARHLIFQAAGNAKDRFPDPLEAATAKLFVAEAAIEVTNAAMQIHGALGYSCDLPLERMVRDARMYAIGGGTTEILRNTITARLLRG